MVLPLQLGGRLPLLLLLPALLVPGHSARLRRLLRLHHRHLLRPVQLQAGQLRSQRLCRSKGVGCKARRAAARLCWPASSGRLLCQLALLLLRRRRRARLRCGLGAQLLRPPPLVLLRALLLLPHAGRGAAKAHDRREPGGGGAVRHNARRRRRLDGLCRTAGRARGRAARGSLYNSRASEHGCMAGTATGAWSKASPSQNLTVRPGVPRRASGCLAQARSSRGAGPHVGTARGDAVCARGFATGAWRRWLCAGQLARDTGGHRLGQRAAVWCAEWSRAGRQARVSGGEPGLVRCAADACKCKLSPSRPQLTERGVAPVPGFAEARQALAPVHRGAAACPRLSVAGRG